MSQKIEIEKRFLLKSLPDVTSLFGTAQEILQGYYRETEEPCNEFRLRSTKDTVTGETVYEKVIKTNLLTGINLERDAQKLTQEEAVIEVRKESLGSLRKRRYTFKDVWKDELTGHVSDAEIDIIRIDGFKAPLIILEIEVGRLDFEINFPDWLEPYVVMEITGIQEFSNRAIAVHNQKRESK